jgi:hypothetical protein
MFRKLATFFGLALLVTSCSSRSEDPVMCTLIACSDGITVELQGDVPSSYTVTARAGTQTRTRECSAAQPCAPILFENFTPETVTIEVTTAAGTVRREITPEYRTVRPNGPDCPPECRQARIVITL